MALAAEAVAGFPGPALLLGRDGTAAPANPAGSKMLAEADPGLRRALAGIAATATGAGTRLVALAAEPGTELLLLPLAEEGRVLALLHDAPLARNLREALIESRQRYKDLVEISSDFAWETDAAGRFTFVSPRGVLGWTPEALLGRAAADFLAEPGEDNAFATSFPVASAELWFRRADGGSARLGIVAAPLRDGAGRTLGARGIGRDLTAERERDGALARAQLRDRLFSHLVRAIRDELEPETALAAAVSATGLALGAAGGIILRRLGETLAPAASWGAPLGAALLDAARATLAAADQASLAVGGWEIIGHAARYRQAVEGAILLWRKSEDGGFPDSDRSLLVDVAGQLGVAIAQVAQHEHILSLSRTDPLTGLLNRRAFFDELERRLRRLERDARPAVLLYVDMDNFKRVNDVHGHRAGDEAIHALCRILRAESRSGDLLVRLGGDEFALWIEGLGSRAGGERAEALLHAAEALKALSGDAQHPLGISLGLAVAEPGSGESPEQLVARADNAMYRAKAAGKGGLALAPPLGKVPA
ncbi:MAG TPA: sensor domain-containing diguanylate cyclase [Stellaceae bacterium]|nr:sensor domain-containing diguanylate cyclase [Stellaceae bacterium]